MQSISDKDQSWAKGHSYVLACEEHRNLAVLKLQLHVDEEQFSEHLKASVSIWLDFCRGVAAGQKYAEESFCGSRFYPFFDALAIADTSHAMEIATYYPEPWQPECEHEEDYLYYKFLCQHLLSLKKKSTSSPNEILQRWKTAVNRKLGNDFSICAGLLNGDRDEFGSGLLGLIEEREENFKHWRKTASYMPEVEYCNRYVYVNGLGLVALAALSNISIDDSIPALPGIHLVEGFPAGSFRQFHD